MDNYLISINFLREVREPVAMTTRVARNNIPSQVGGALDQAAEGVHLRVSELLSR